MTSVNPAGPTQYQPQYGSGPQQAGYNGQQPVNPYYGDGYRPSPYTTGYATGVNAVGGAAMGMSSMSTGVSSMANSLGGIFGTIIDLIANILNTIVNLIAKVIGGILGLFGIGKKDENAQNAPGTGAPQTMPLPGNQGMGVVTPAGTPVPPPPPGTDIQAAYSVVAGDLANIQDPNQGIQIINIHAMKAKDYRAKAEQFAKEAEKESREAAYAAEQLQSNPNKLGDVQTHKSKAMELLKTAQEYTKAVYDESLYAQAVNDILNGKFQGALGNKGSQQVTDAWKNWIGGSTETSFVFFKTQLRAAPEVFMQSLNAVNANIGRATQILSGMGAGVQ